MSSLGFKMIEEVFSGLLLSLLLGALIGAQREIRLQKRKLNDFAGFRTFTLVAVLGYLMGFLGSEILDSRYFILFSVFAMFFMVIFAYRAVTKMYPSQISVTSEVSALLTFILGTLVSLGYYHLSISIAIIIASILFLGNALHKFAKNLKQSEAFATLKFALISIVILPILPNKDYTLLDFWVIGDFLRHQNFINQELLVQLDIFNFYHIWLMVVFISGIAYVGYILMKTVGAEKGIEITGFLGGLMSSTALTSSFAIESRKLNYLSNPLIIGTVIACSTMFFRIIFEVAVINPSLLLGITLMLSIMGFVGYGAAGYLFYKTRLSHVKKVEMESPFTLGPAMKFAFFFVVIIFVSKLFTIVFGEGGVYLVAFFSGFADVDAVTITLSNLAKSGDISVFGAQFGILIAAFANTIFKGSIAYYLGSRKFSRGIILIFSLIILVGFISAFLLY